MSKLLCFRELGVSSRVVSNFVHLFSFIYYIYYTIYILFINISYYLTTLLYILLYFNKLRVGSKLIFLVNQLTTLLPYLIHRKILYVNVTDYNNIDIFTKLIRQCNNLYKSYILKKLIYRTYIYMRTYIYE